MLFVNINSSDFISLYIMGIVAINKMISSNQKFILILFFTNILYCLVRVVCLKQINVFLAPYKVVLTYFSGIEQEISCSSLHLADYQILNLNFPVEYF